MTRKTRQCALCGRIAPADELVRMPVPAIWCPPGREARFIRIGSRVCDWHVDECRASRPNADLSARRTALGISSAELAEQIGISSSYMRDLENGKRPGLHVCVRWLVTLDRLESIDKASRIAGGES